MSALRDSLPRGAGDWHRYARIVVVATLIISFAWGGVRLVDPIPKTDGADPVAVEVPAAEVAHDALTATRTGNYRYVVVAGNGSWRHEIYRFSVDAADQQYLHERLDGDDDERWTTYVDESGLWVRDRETGTWYLNRPRGVSHGLGPPGAVRTRERTSRWSNATRRQR